VVLKHGSTCLLHRWGLPDTLYELRGDGMGMYDDDAMYGVKKQRSGELRRSFDKFPCLTGYTLVLNWRTSVIWSLKPL
jgi:hypothetical protein